MGEAPFLFAPILHMQFNIVQHFKARPHPCMSSMLCFNFRFLQVFVCL